MFELYAITSDSIPKRLNGIEGGYALRPISIIEILSIEDFFFSEGSQVLQSSSDFTVSPLTST